MKLNPGISNRAGHAAENPQESARADNQPNVICITDQNKTYTTYDIITNNNPSWSLDVFEKTSEQRSNNRANAKECKDNSVIYWAKTELFSDEKKKPDSNWSRDGDIRCCEQERIRPEDRFFSTYIADQR